jgi:hypothetical protein
MARAAGAPSGPQLYLASRQRPQPPAVVRELSLREVSHGPSCCRTRCACRIHTKERGACLCIRGIDRRSRRLHRCPGPSWLWWIWRLRRTSLGAGLRRRPRRCCRRGTAASAVRSGRRRTASGLVLDQRILDVAGQSPCLGRRPLGCAATRLPLAAAPVGAHLIGPRLAREAGRLASVGGRSGRCGTAQTRTARQGHRAVQHIFSQPCG